MKTAILRKHGKGWKLEGKKTINVAGDYGLTDDMDGLEVEFDNTGGPIRFILFNGAKYEKKQRSFSQGPKSGNKFGSSHHRQNSGQKRQSYGNQRNSGQRDDPARAPYNFVPLNEQVVPAEESTDFDQYAIGRYSGYIHLDIRALSDIFVRGQLEQFFAVNGNYAIPGSSLRGLIRSMVEMVSYSKMDMVDRKRKLFFRNISDQFYKDLFLGKDKTTNSIRQKSLAGWLSRSGNTYHLQPAPTFYKVDRRSLSSIGLDLQEETYKTKTIWFDPRSVDPIHEKKIKDRRTGQVKRTFNLYYNKVKRISRKEQSGYERATLLITGLFGKAKHFQWIIPYADPSRPSMNVTKIMEDYAMDENRDEGADLIKALKKAKGKAVPCFFLPDQNGTPIAIGHTGIFRHPYKYRIGNAIQQTSTSELDMAKSIFGYADPDGKKDSIRAGKVFFEDAYATEVVGKEFGALHILSSPKPTSFQLYLEQEGGNETHWGTDRHKIRGYKQYWHSRRNWRLATNRSQKDLIRTALKEKSEQFTVGEVLKEGSTFAGRIRFENLSDAELGALLFALDLPEGCAHKLGMGKSLGLGSVRLSTRLTLLDRVQRYSKLFDDTGNWEMGEVNDRTPEYFKQQFVNYVFQHLQRPAPADWETYWQDERMQELKCMLNVHHPTDEVSWENRTRYMMIEHPHHEPKNEYRNKYTRHVLPKPSEVVKPNTYRKE